MKSEKRSPGSVLLFCLLAGSSVIILSCKTGTRKELTSGFTRSDQIVADANVVMPPAWAFGVLYGGYTNQEETIARITEIRRHDYPIDAYWIDSWFWSYVDKGRGPDKYMDFVGDTVAYPDRKQMWKFMENNNIKGGFWVWDCILKDGNEDVYQDFESKGFFSRVFLNTNSWHNKGNSTAMFQEGKGQGTWCGDIDFKNAEAVAYFKTRMRPFLQEGADFIKLDRTSDVAVCKAMFELTQEFSKGRGFILSHSDGTDTEEYKRYPAKWTDDTRSDWTVRKPTKRFNNWVPRVAFEENILMFTDSSRQTSRIPFLTNDTGGFDIGINALPDEELYIRWVQFSTFNPIMEVFSQPENTTANLAFNYSPFADSVFRHYTHLRLQLFPYIYSYAIRSRLEGRRMVTAAKNNLDFFFGNEFLVAPVTSPGERRSTVEFPEGNWISFWNDEKFSAGSAEVTLPLSQLPVFVRAGSIIPMREYAPSVEQGTNDLIVLHLYPDTADFSAEFVLIEDDGKSNEYLSGAFATTRLMFEGTNHKGALTINARQGTYSGASAERKWKFIIHGNPEATIFIGNKPLQCFSRGTITESVPVDHNNAELLRVEVR